MDLDLIIALLNGRFETVKLLLKNGVDIHADDDYCIRWTSYFGHTETVKFLEKGVDIHAKDDQAIQDASWVWFTNSMPALSGIHMIATLSGL
jgi:ankyrin repeat protein